MRRDVGLKQLRQVDDVCDLKRRDGLPVHGTRLGL